MTDTLERLAEGASPTSETVVYTATTKTSVRCITAVNPSGGTTESIIVKLNDVRVVEVALDSPGDLTWDGVHALESGEEIAVEATDASVEYMITGVLIT